MAYSVCLIDDAIPASGPEAAELEIRDSALLNASNLLLLLKKAQWSDPVVRSLVEALLTQIGQDGISPKWEVSGFTNPSFYINALESGLFRADVIVFDWEYPGAQNAGETNSESILRQILEQSFSLVFVFSGADKQPEIEHILAKPEFLEFKERIRYLDKTKDGASQTEVLLQRSDEMYAQNFSFKFANVLRRSSVQCADQILSDMGRVSLNDVKNLVAVGHGGKKDFVDFLAERFRTSIASPNIYELIEEIPEASVDSADRAEDAKLVGPESKAEGTTKVDESTVSKMWSYRLYFQQETGDQLVRRGDIVAVDEEVLLVLSADCDLVRFWSKNLGIINGVALHEFNQANQSLRDLLTVCVKPDPKAPINSLLGKVGDTEGPFVLPFVPKGNRLTHFVAVPKDLVSKRIPTPPGWEGLGAKARKAHPMKYEYWANARRLCSLSEPFLTPIIQHVFGVVGGYGVPDYPLQMKEILAKILENFNKAPEIESTQSTPDRNAQKNAVASGPNSSDSTSKASRPTPPPQVSSVTSSEPEPS